MAFIPPYPALSEKQIPVAVLDWFRKLRGVFTSFLSKSVAGGVSVNLSTDDTYSNIMEFTGVLTANINIIVATITKQFTVFNNTTGAFTVTIKTSSGTGIVVGQGKRAILYCDGTNVVRVTADT